MRISDWSSDVCSSDLRINEMPQVEVHIVESAEPPTGVGEPGVPPIGPAVANAVYKATGRRIRALPFALHGLSAAYLRAQPRLPPAWPCSRPPPPRARKHLV